MADRGGQGVLGRKAQAAQRAFEARGMSPGKALRRALSRAADVLWDLALVGQGVQTGQVDQDGVVEALGNDSLLLLLDGPEGAVGLAELDRTVVAALVEVQTIRQVTTLPPDDRPLTATDAAMAAPLLDSALERFAVYLAESPLQAQVLGYRFGAMIEDPRSAALLLDATGYRVFRVEVDLALGRKHGAVSLFLPDRPVSASATPADGAPGPHEDRMMRVPARLDCVLARLTVPLSRAEGLKPGDLLDMPGQVLNGAELRAAHGDVVAQGRLGQLNGMRALRILWPPMPRRDQGDPGTEPETQAHAVAALPVATDPMADFEAGPDPDQTLNALPPEEPAAPDTGGEIDFAADAAAFDMGEFDTGPEDDFGSDDAEKMAAEDAFAAEAAGAADEFGGEEGFAAATMDFDFDT